MSTPVSHDQKPTNPHFFKTILTESLKIFSRNKQIYFTIFTLVTLPLSYLHFNLAHSSYPQKSQILHLESLATRTATRFEARQVWRESREHVLSVLHLKLIYFIPSYVLSLPAAVSVISTAESRYSKKPTNFYTALASFKANWARLIVTTLCIYVVLILYSTIIYVFSALFRSSSVGFRFPMWVLFLGFEIYVTAVLAVAVVVSVVENRTGFDAITTAFWVMEGKRVSGWVLFGSLAVVTGGIGRRMEGLTAEEREWAVLIVVYAAVVIWGFVVGTVFYCECRRRHVARGADVEVEEMQEQAGQSLEISS